MRVDDIGVIAPYRKQVEVIRDVVTTRRIGYGFVEFASGSTLTFVSGELKLEV